MNPATLTRDTASAAAPVGRARRAATGLWRWRWSPTVLAILAGLLAAVAQPPWGVLPGLMGYGLMFRLVDAARGPAPLRSAFFRGWLTGVAYFVVSLWWIAEPFKVDAQEQGWMAPFADPIVSMFMALFWGAASVVYRRFATRGALRALFFAGCLSLAEWLRGHILTGFPWDLPGETWRAGGPVSQAAALGGAYGLTFVTLAGAACLFVAAEGRRGARLGLAAVVAWVAIAGWGEWRLRHAPATSPTAPLVRIVQPDVRQESKYDPAMFANIVERYVALTARPSAAPIAAVIWPEGAIPAAMEDYLAPGAWPRGAIEGALQPGETLILGGYRFATSSLGAPETFNTLAAFREGPDGLQEEALYDKYRLVPFGEFMPMDGLMSRLGIKQMVHVGDGFSPGPPPTPRRLPGLPPAQPLICYEDMFPGFTRDGAAAAGYRPAWIINISNDAWFGTASGPRQHVNMAAYRAIEEGLPIARATPTGISGMIDAFGRFRPGEKLGEHAVGDLDVRLPPALPLTVYDEVGDGLFFLLVGLSIVGARWRPVRKVEA
ncbi:MAG TPA: apolipoprotein N-acyltransferase [Caulobacteraceae bacterium]